jgi:hypothetical protein
MVVIFSLLIFFSFLFWFAILLSGNSSNTPPDLGILFENDAFHVPSDNPQLALQLQHLSAAFSIPEGRIVVSLLLLLLLLVVLLLLLL